MDQATPDRLETIVWIALCTALVAAGCGGDEQAGPWEYTYETRASQCEGGPGERTLRIDTDARPIGPSANALIEGPDQLWIVESGSNTLSPAAEGPTIDIGDGRNPYDAALDPARGTFYVPNFLSNSVTVADAQTGEVLEEIEHASLDAPNGVAVTDNYVYVTNSGYRSSGAYADGTVTVIDAATRSVLGTIETARNNPQFVTFAETPNGPRLVVVDTGRLLLEGGEYAVSPAAVEIWRETPDPLSPEKTVAHLDVPADTKVGAPGRATVTLDGRRAFFTSATAPVLFELDLETGEWLRGADNPIVLYPAAGDALDHSAIGRDGILYVSAFNSEELILYDTRCNALIGRFDISANDTLNSGPHSIAISRSDANTADGYIIGSLSNALIEFEVE